MLWRTDTIGRERIGICCSMAIIWNMLIKVDSTILINDTMLIPKRSLSPNTAFDAKEFLSTERLYYFKGISRRATCQVEGVYIYIYKYITCITCIRICMWRFDSHILSCDPIFHFFFAPQNCMTGFLLLSPLLWGSWRGALQPDLRSLSQSAVENSHEECLAIGFCYFVVLICFFVSWWVLSIISHGHDPWSSFRWNMFHHLFDSWTLSDDTSFNHII